MTDKITQFVNTTWGETGPSATPDQAEKPALNIMRAASDVANLGAAARALDHLFVVDLETATARSVLRRKLFEYQKRLDELIYPSNKDDNP